jgi:hypothetical protein
VFAQQQGPPPVLLISLICGALLISLVAALVPLVLGLSRGHQGLAWGSLGAGAVGWFVLGPLLSVPIAIVFTIIILSQPRADEQRRRYRDYDDYDDRRPPRRYRDDYDRPSRRDEEDDYDRPSRRSREDDRPARGDRPPPKPDSPKDSPPLEGFGFREIE